MDTFMKLSKRWHKIVERNVCEYVLMAFVNQCYRMLKLEKMRNPLVQVRSFTTQAECEGFETRGGES